MVWTLGLRHSRRLGWGERTDSFREANSGHFAMSENPVSEVVEHILNPTVVLGQPRHTTTVRCNMARFSA